MTALLWAGLALGAGAGLTWFIVGSDDATPPPEEYWKLEQEDAKARNADHKHE